MVDKWLPVLSSGEAATFVSRTIVCSVVGCACVVLTSLIVYRSTASPIVRSALYYITVVLTTISVYLAIDIQLEHNFILSFAAFLFNHGNLRRYMLLVFWTLCTVGTMDVFACASATVNYQRRTQQLTRTALHVRKFYHFVVSLVYVSGVLYDAQLTNLATVAITCAFIVLECARALQVQPIGEAIESVVRPFLDAQDSGSTVTTHVLLLMGVCCPLWIHTWLLKTRTLHLSHFAGVISVGVGDACAALVGRTWGRTRVGRNGKSVEGTTACTLSQFAISLLFSRLINQTLSVDQYFIIAVISLTSSLLELCLTRFDNVLLPLCSFALMWWCL